MLRAKILPAGWFAEPAMQRIEDCLTSMGPSNLRGLALAGIVLATSCRPGLVKNRAQRTIQTARTEVTFASWMIDYRFAGGLRPAFHSTQWQEIPACETP